MDKKPLHIPNVKEAGRSGGLIVLRNRGKAYYSEIGKLGQAATRQKYPNMASAWGKMGGRPKKPELQNLMGEKSKQNCKEGIADPPIVCAFLPLQ